MYKWNTQNSMFGFLIVLSLIVYVRKKENWSTRVDITIFDNFFVFA